MKKEVESIVIILKLLLNIQMICNMFIKILKNTIQEKKGKVLIVFDDMIAGMISNKNLNSIVTELFIRGWKLNILPVFITQPYFKVSKDVRLNMKISNRVSTNCNDLFIRYCFQRFYQDLLKMYCKTVLFFNQRYNFQMILYDLEKLF